MYTLRRYSRRRINILLGLLSLILVVTLAACSNEPAATTTEATEGAMPSEFRIGYQVVPNAELLTKNQGFAEAKFPDVDIQWLPFDSGRDVNTAMVSGGIDVGLAGSVPVSTGIAQDLPYQVYFIHDIIGDNEALAVTEASGIQSMADVPGKKIGVPFGSTTHFSLLSALESEGIDPADVQILDMQPQDMLAAWQRGDIDGGFVWHPTLSKMLDAGGSVLVTAKELSEKGIITADLGIVNKEFADTYPDFLAGYVDALDEAVQFYRNEPEAAAAAMSEEIGLSPEESLEVMNELVWVSADEQASEKYLGTPEEAGAMSQVLKDSAEFMVKQEAIPSAPDLEAYRAALFNQAVAQ
ncbi:ABC transporter substrate-binding protein [cf. Phormidesmis sp. LEGE 11477]|uniref:taurine ABC transporter substrate-binding protein n=1 Tax=cf. Phormidesmis sp. LEGE 11477 TaxID=1828680 RepID=UPI00187ED835|nr:ABC transporter substrate-binding protein [cf. Phormidesmis sp. LEGE 11477]MBE9060510.1 ABC transporter substrate-binding protein [cf. Phormidesmis sp. LEGE 11477]